MWLGNAEGNHCNIVFKYSAPSLQWINSVNPRLRLIKKYMYIRSLSLSLSIRENMKAARPQEFKIKFKILFLCTSIGHGTNILLINSSIKCPDSPVICLAMLKNTTCDDIKTDGLFFFAYFRRSGKIRSSLFRSSTNQIIRYAGFSIIKVNPVETNLQVQNIMSFL